MSESEQFASRRRNAYISYRSLESVFIVGFEIVGDNFAKNTGEMVYASCSKKPSGSTWKSVSSIFGVSAELRRALVSGAYKSRVHVERLKFPGPTVIDADSWERVCKH